jgi:hypothetical protein
LSIDELASGLDLSPKKRVANRLLGHQVDATGKEAFEFLSEVEVAASVSRRGLPVGHLDEEVQIAGRLEATRCRRTEKVKALDPVASAKVHERGKVSFNKLGHRFLHREF